MSIIVLHNFVNCSKNYFFRRPLFLHAMVRFLASYSFILDTENCVIIFVGIWEHYSSVMLCFLFFTVFNFPDMNFWKCVLHAHYLCKAVTANEKEDPCALTLILHYHMPRTKSVYTRRPKSTHTACIERLAHLLCRRTLSDPKRAYLATTKRVMWTLLQSQPNGPIRNQEDITLPTTVLLICVQSHNTVVIYLFTTHGGAI